MDSPSLYLPVPDLVTPQELKRLKELAAAQAFEDGRKTASLAALSVKNNLQMAREKMPGENEQEQIVFQAIMRHPTVSACVMPQMVFPPMISKYEAGMYYGWHIDSPVMSLPGVTGVPPVRTDVAMTLFLHDPASYEGGELVVQSPAGLVQFKLPAGHAVFYPADRLHCVAEVKSGVRLCAVTWIQSMVRNAEQRELLVTTNYLHGILSSKDVKSPEAQLALAIYSNLLRMWRE